MNLVTFQILEPCEYSAPLDWPLFLPSVNYGASKEHPLPQPTFSSDSQGFHTLCFGKNCVLYPKIHPRRHGNFLCPCIFQCQHFKFICAILSILFSNLPPTSHPLSTPPWPSRFRPGVTHLPMRSPQGLSRWPTPCSTQVP